ncbi:protein O-mannose kinase-like [Saccostrea echinata]|uniref:protein O-mannose kinase-like n=1 Tax=Saccostrea echinata TaxID=191078 RepID=UPI002A7F6D3F|nr:protein O-mannose kinase-like [Saccostrea echinata]
MIYLDRPWHIVHHVQKVKIRWYEIETRDHTTRFKKKIKLEISTLSTFQTIYLTLGVIVHIPILYLVWYSSHKNKHSLEPICIQSIIQGKELCRPLCQYGQFSLYGMHQCRPWLTCDDLQQVEKITRIGRGLVKEVYVARWKDFVVAYSQLTSPHYQADFQQGIQVLKHFHGHQRIVQLIGFCDNIMITEFHSLGEATKFNKHLETFPEVNSIFRRFQFCIDYVEILSKLHSTSDDKAYVMCDTNSLDKVFTQYLLSEDMRLVLNDVDSVAMTTKVSGKWRGIKCGNRELDGEFVAPEQRWSRITDFNDSEMQTYDEKTDIWKVPSVCNYFLGNSLQATNLQMRLLDIHMACKHVNLSRRPTALHILWTYRNLLKQLQDQDLFVKEV